MRLLMLVLVALGLGTKRHWHIFFAIVFGVVLGIALPVTNGITPLHQVFEFVGQVFIRLITMLVIPLVVSSLIVGVSSLGDGRKLGRMGGKVLSLFLIIMAISAVVGAGLALVIEPGSGVKPLIEQQQDNLTLLSQSQLEELETLKSEPQDLKALFFNMIPQNPIESLAKMDLVPVIVFTILAGIAVAFIGDAGKPIISLFESIFTATMKLTDWIMVLAPTGVFALAFVTVSRVGIDVFIQLLPFAMVVLIGLIIQVGIVFPIMLKMLAKIDFMNLYRAISEAIMVAFGTASSSATLPITIACCERQGGISNRIASFVLPTGATLSKTGTTLFEVVAVMFLLQAYGIPLDVTKVLFIITFSIIASIGTAGVPSAALITLWIVLNGIGENINPQIFTVGIGLLWAFDRAIDMCRTVVNVISSCTVAAIVANSEGELNRDILNNRNPSDDWLDNI